MPTASRLAVWLLLLVAPESAGAQVVRPPDSMPPDAPHLLRLSLDCQAIGCDLDFLRTDLDWVEYVRDQHDADVHVLVTSQGTGSGGAEVLLSFHGKGMFEALTDEVRYSLPEGSSPDEQREALSRVLQIGLSRYLLHTPLGALAGRFSFQRVPGNKPTVAHHDPWNYWVFRIGLNAAFSGESRSSSVSGSANLHASRTTAEWKIRLDLSGDSNRNRYEFQDGTTFLARAHSYYGGGLLVRSVGDHLSLGGTADASSLSRRNLDFSMRIAPRVEYDVFPYDQYSRRRLVASYSIGVDRYVYADTTIYNRIQETRLDQQLALTYATTQPWGSAGIGVNGFHYLSQVGQNHLSISSDLSLRVTRGLRVSYAFWYSRVRDQLTLPKGDATDAEILLALRQLATTYTYGSFLSVSYTFGSLFNSVVNPRMTALQGN